MKPKIKAIFFDWDDTLNVHNKFKKYGEDAAIRILEANLMKRGIKVNKRNLYRVYKNTEHAMFSRKDYNRIRIWKATLERLGLKLDDELIRNIVEEYWKNIEAKSHLVKNAACVLRELRRKGYKIGIIADYDDDIRDKRKVIISSAIGNFFDVIILGGLDLPTTKPDPIIFLYACQKIGCNPTEAIMVGDSPDDVIGAEMAGMISVLIKHRKERIGRYKINNLAEILSLLK